MTEPLVDAPTELLAGYYVDPATGAWCSLPWPSDPQERQRIADSSLGPLVIKWAENRLGPDQFEKFGPGLIDYKTGQPWRFTTGQKRFLILWYQYDEDGRYVYRRAVKRGAKGPITHSTPVMTPDGWVKHGDLRIGSQVYAVDGSITTVTDLRPEVLEDTYRITFRDGSSVECTGTHRWPVDVFVGRSNRVRRIVTVDDMLAEGLTFERALTTGRTKATRGGVARFRALPSPAVEGIEADLGMDPYVLGYWLGDGDSDCARVTGCTEDLGEFTAELDRLGIEHGQPSATHGDTHRMRIGSGTQKALRDLGVLGHKHIPGSVLRGSLSQRWAVMQGLVDTDGTVSARGQVEICILDNQLGHDVFELAVSLGLMPTKSYRNVTLGGKTYGPYVRIRFTPQPGEIVCRLARKLARCKTEAGTSPFSRSRTIVEIEKIDPTPARCLTVAHEAHQYLVGAHNVPTCNSGKDPFAAAHGDIELAGPSHLVWDEETNSWTGVPHRMPLVQVASNSESQSKDVLWIANAMWSDEARDWHGLDTGATRTVLKGRGRFEVLTASEASSEGDPATFIILNESHHMTATSGGHRVAKVARRNVGKSPEDMQARLCEYTNAHAMGMDSTAQRSFESWQKQISGQYPNLKRDILYDSIEADPNLSIIEPEQLRLALSQAYSDSHWYDPQRVEAEVLDPDTTPSEAIRFYLNGLAVREDAWVDPRNWDALARPDIVVADREQIAMFLDCSKSSDATGLVAVRISDGHVITLGVWQAPKGGRGRSWLAPRDEVDAKVRETFDRYKVLWFGVDPSPTTDDDTEANYWKPTIDAWHRDFHPKLSRWGLWATPGATIGHSVMFDMRTSQRGARERLQAFTEMAEQCAQWIDEDQAITHDGDSALRLHVHNARLYPTRFGASLGKESRSSKNHVDLAVCMVGAQLGRRLVLNNPKIRTGNASSSRGGRTSTGRETFVPS